MANRPPRLVHNFIIEGFKAATTTITAFPAYVRMISASGAVARFTPQEARALADALIIEADHADATKD